VPLAALLCGKLVAAREILGVAWRGGWRWLLVIGGLGAVFVLLMRAQLPESPRWLESRGRHAEAAGVVRSVASKVYGRPAELTLVSPPLALGEDEARTWRDVLGTAFRDYRKRTVMLFVFQVQYCRPWPITYSAPWHRWCW
jgi:MFS transporter, putative metabolite:H+ symporter